MTRALIGVLLTLALATPASAAPPELFIRESPWDTHEPVSGWIPLASAPVSSYVGGYEIGYRVQAAGLHRVALTVAGVPDGAPNQPYNATPYCVGRNDAPGSIVSAGPELQFEGNGRYTVSVSVGAGTDCTTVGETASGADFARATGVVKGSRGAKRVKFALTAEFAAESAGGSVTVKVLRVLGCNGPNYKVRSPRPLMLSASRKRFGFAGRFPSCS